MTAFAILVVALNLATLAVVWLFLQRQLEHAQLYNEHRLDSLRGLIDKAGQSHIVAPDPRVDELMRVVSTLKGAEALKQMFGKNQ